MALEDVEMLDRALDAAQSKLDETSVETPDAPAVETEAPAEDLILDKAFVDKANDEAKELKKETKAVKEKAPKALKLPVKEPEKQEEISDQVADVEVDASIAQETAAKESVTPPTFWTTEQKNLFAKAPRDLQEVIAKRELEMQQHQSRLANEAHRGKQIETKIGEVFEPYRLKLQANGISDPIEAASRLLAWNELFEKDPYSAISDLMQKNGFTPNDFLEDAKQFNQVPVDPRVDEALEAAREAKQMAAQWQQNFETQKQQQVLSQVESFKQSKDSRGFERRAFAEMYAPQIAKAVDELQQNQPNMPLMEVLNHAYEFVHESVTKLHGKLIPAPKPPERVVADAKKAEAAATSVNGAPTNGVTAKRPHAKTFDEAFERAQARMGQR